VDTGDATPDGTCDTGTLREAIQEANANNNDPTVDLIDFAIPGTDCAGGVCKISPSSELPHITDPVIIDGYSQTGASPNTLAVGNDAVLKTELSGASIPTASFPNGLKIKADNSTVKGLVVSNWENGVFLDTGATGYTVRGDFVGTNASGADLGNNIGVVALDANNLIG
jgi:CSLREA domain-containing protein